jgi:phi13 family phage major tail protein
MAKIGLRYLLAAKLNESGAYEGGIEFAKAIKAETTSNTSDDTVLYANDEQAERASSPGTTSIAITADEIDDETYAFLLGHTYSETDGLTINENDQAPELGIGYCRSRQVNNIVTFRAHFLPRVKFSEPSDTGETKGATTSFTTYDLTGSVLSPTSGNREYRKTFDTADAALTWLKEKLGMTTGG